MIEWFEGSRSALADLFALADDSPEQVERYRDLGRVLVARDGPTMVGHLQLIPGQHADEAEVKSPAVREDRQGSGNGRALMNRAIAVCREENRSALLMSTATADTGALRFYQRLGFRFLRVERDVFTPQAGYPPTEIDGVPLRDQIWLSLALDDSPVRPDATQLRVADIPSASTSSYGSTATGWGSSKSAASRTTTATTACASQFRAPVPTSNSPRAGATALPNRIQNRCWCSTWGANNRYERSPRGSVATR